MRKEPIDLLVYTILRSRPRTYIDKTPLQYSGLISEHEALLSSKSKHGAEGAGIMNAVIFFVLSVLSEHCTRRQ